MRTLYHILILLLIANICFSQSFIKRKFPNTSADIQFAGSVGLLSAGVSKISKKENIEIGFSFGHLPHNFGGSVQTVNLKFRCNPLSLKCFKGLSLQPIQTGVFISQSFGEKLPFDWPVKYPKGYYWWNPSLRYHFFFGTQISYSLNKSLLKKISCYVEANTNDLYIYSFIPNSKALSIYDIFFLGIGTKLHFR